MKKPVEESLVFPSGLSDQLFKRSATVDQLLPMLRSELKVKCGGESPTVG
jgi:hypothetical protein